MLRKLARGSENITLDVIAPLCKFTKHFLDHRNVFTYGLENNNLRVLKFSQSTHWHKIEFTSVQITVIKSHHYLRFQLLQKESLNLHCDGILSSSSISESSASDISCRIRNSWLMVSWGDHLDRWRIDMDVGIQECSLSFLHHKSMKIWSLVCSMVRESWSYGGIKIG